MSESGCADRRSAVVGVGTIPVAVAAAVAAASALLPVVD
jgi:hypothetical protein